MMMMIMIIIIIIIIIILKPTTNFYVSDKEKAQRDKGGGRTLLGDGTDGGVAVILRPIRLQCAGAWITAGCPCICINNAFTYTCTNSGEVFAYVLTWKSSLSPNSNTLEPNR